MAMQNEDSTTLVRGETRRPIIEIDEVDRASRPGYEIWAWPQGTPDAILIDFDGTFYQNERWVEAMNMAEAHGVIQTLHEKGLFHIYESNFPGSKPDEISHEDAYIWFNGHRARMTEELQAGRKARATETALNLGLTMDEWNEMRVRVRKDLDPTRYFEEDGRVYALVERLMNSERPYAITTNSPTDSVRSILCALGIDQEYVNRINIIGPDTLDVAKPDPAYYPNAVNVLSNIYGVEISPANCVVIGDDPDNDAGAGINARMGGVRIHMVDDIFPVLDLLDSICPFDVREIVGLVQPDIESPNSEDWVKVIALTGRAGAGKTTTSEQIKAAYESVGIHCQIVALDAYFNRSSADRAAWLAEVENLSVDHPERIYREDQDHWWDFDAVRADIQTLNQGRAVHRERVYTRVPDESGKKGTLTGTLDITPDTEHGSVIILEGVGVPRVSTSCDYMIYLNTHPRVRDVRLDERDGDKRQGEAALRRRVITDRYEDGVFSDLGKCIGDMNGNIIVLNNSRNGGGDHLIRLPGVIPIR